MVKIITYAHKRPDFIYLQYESIKKHFKSEYEYIVFNNSIDSLKEYDEIHRICNELDIKCVDVQLVDDIRVTHGEINYTGNRYTNPNVACSYPLIWTFRNYLSTKDEVVCLIDSDMFFINNIDIEYEIKDKDIIYIPQYRDNNVSYIWNAFACFNIKRRPDLLNLDWHPGVVNGSVCDVGGQTYFNLIKGNYKSSYIEEYSIRDYTNENGILQIHYIQNGNINYNLTMDINKNASFFRHSGGVKYFPNKSFTHELDREDYTEYIRNRVISILDIFEKNNINLPDPKHIGFIGFADRIDFFIVHYKSGSNYLDFSTDSYNFRKTQELKKLLKYDNI